MASPEERSSGDLAAKADAFRMYVDARDRRYRLQLLKDVFVGSEAVDSIVFAGVASSRTEAVELGRTLMKELRFFTSVKGDDKFSDKRNAYYRFSRSDLKRMSLEGASKNTKTADEATLKELRKLAEAFQQLVEVKDRKYRFRRYKRCFIGAEAVDEMVSSGMAESRVEAVLLGRAMERELELFKHVSYDKQFSDEYLFFQFTDSDLSSGSMEAGVARAMTITRRPSEHAKKYIRQGAQNEALNSSDSSADSFAQWRNSRTSGVSNDISSLLASEYDAANGSRLGASISTLPPLEETNETGS
jgi:Domain found in Dishevelled, Egl-10, and Pleckstrin (DEP)